MVCVRNEMASRGDRSVESQHSLDGLGEVIFYYRRF